MLLSALQVVSGVALVATGWMRRLARPQNAASPKLLEFWGATLLVEGVLQYLFWALLDAHDREVVWVVGALAFIAVPISAHQRTQVLRRSS